MITVEHLTKCYGDFMAVSDLSFEIDEGHVYGFLGPNGAGKSTTMNIMAGCLSATEGKVIIDGHDIFEEPEKAKKLIGYLPEQPPLYMNETPVEYLKFVGAAKGLKGRELQRQVEEVIGQVRIDEVKNRLISKLSKGYRQRAEGITCQAFGVHPAQHVPAIPDFPLDQRHMVFPVQTVHISVCRKRSVLCRHHGGGHAIDQFFTAFTVMLQIPDSYKFHFPSLRQFPKPGSAHHGSVLPHNLTAKAAFLQAGQPAQIHNCLCVPVSFKNAVRPCQKGKHMARPAEILRF